jgi:hypothetical protein
MVLITTDRNRIRKALSLADGAPLGASCNESTNESRILRDRDQAWP